MSPDQIMKSNQLLYKPVMYWVDQRLKEYESGSNKGPLFIALNAPQGSGKTTLTSTLVKSYGAKGISAINISIDDFYLRGDEQDSLSEKYSTNDYLAQRGYPGTHDIELGVKVLNSIKEYDSQNSDSLLIPRYDKSARSGRGDRCPESSWTYLNQKPQIIFFEGWMLGFEPKESEDSNLNIINEFLDKYKRWESFFHGFIQLYAEEFDYIRDWRIEAEEKMKASGNNGMRIEEVTAYIAKFIPAYENYRPQLLDRNWEIPNLKLKIGKDRLPIQRGV